MPPPRPSPHRAAPYHHGDLAEALAGEAMERVRHEGSQHLSLRAVAQAVGVSPSAAYHHFPDKDALLREVGHRGSERLDARVDAAVAGIVGDDDRALVRRMRAIGEAYLDFAVEEPNLFRHTFGPLCAQDSPHAGAEPGAEGPAVHGPGTHGVYAQLVETLDAMEAAGMLRRRDGVDLLAWTVVHGLSGLLIDGLLPMEARALVLRTVLESVLADPERLPELLAD